MVLRRALVVAVILASSAGTAKAGVDPQSPGQAAAPQRSSAAVDTPAEFAARLKELSSLDYRTRTHAARLIRRTPASEAVPLLLDAARMHPDEFVRYRALALLTGFGDRRTPEVMRALAADRNDRIREVVYKWLEQHPDGSLAPRLVGALQGEQAEFVRPALIGALAALGDDVLVQRALIVEAGRGLDFFRAAVVDALGRHHADYALDQIAGMTTMDGPLQDDAILAVGRIGGARASSVLAGVTGASREMAMSLAGARCLLGEDCQAQIDTIVAAAAAPRATPVIVRAAVSSLGAIAVSARPADQQAALAALATLADRETLSDIVAVELGTAAVRAPQAMLTWLGRLPPAGRDGVIGRLRDGLDSLEEDYGEEQLFAATRAAYWAAPEGSQGRALAAVLIDRLAF